MKLPWMTTLAAALALGAAPMLMTGCEEDDVDDAVDEVEDAADDAADEIEDGADEIEDGLE